MSQAGSDFELCYEDFEYKGYSEKYFYYEVPLDKFCEGIRIYFGNYGVDLDGKDTDVYNVILSLGEYSLDSIFDAIEDYLHKECKEYAYEEFKDYVERYMVDDE